jgi:hypothetical protein
VTEDAIPLKVALQEDTKQFFMKYGLLQLLVCFVNIFMLPLYYILWTILVSSGALIFCPTNVGLYMETLE